MIESDPLIDDWSSILTRECNPYLIGNAPEMGESKTERDKQYSKQYEGFGYMSNQSNLIQGTSSEPTQLMNGSPLEENTLPYLDSPWTKSNNGSAEFSDVSSGMASTPCECGQQVLQQLHSLTNLLENPAAFDTALSRNKQAVNLCHTILSDQSHRHYDVSFVMTLTALIAKVIAVYDQTYDIFHQQAGSSYLPIRNLNSLHDLEMGNERLTAPSPGILDTCKIDSPHSSSTSLSGIISPSRSSFPVRLTLGTYQLDHEDEEKLRSDIFKIELSKVKGLVGAFEQNFCDAIPQNHQQSKYEGKAFEDMLYYLKKRLRVSLERPSKPATAFV